MTGLSSARPVLVALLVFLGVAGFSVFAGPRTSGFLNSISAERQHLARVLLNSAKVDLLRSHISGVRDEATAFHNLRQASIGAPVKRSYYGNAPGGTTRLDIRMLRALYILADEGHSFRITELAGGSHSRKSRHYVGVAFDIDILDGREISLRHPTCRAFMKRCRELGATEVIGPGSRGHSTHIHVAWPRG